METDIAFCHRIAAALKSGPRPRGPSAGDPVESLISLENTGISGRFDHEVHVRATHQVVKVEGILSPAEF
jgi:hypothetical protein